MKEVLKTVFPQQLRWQLHPMRSRVERQIWRLKGRPAEGRFFKQQRCLEIGQEYGCRILVETGTFMGDMVDATRSRFDEVHTIEVFKPLYEQAKRRFSGAKNVFLYEGDSAHCLPDVLHRVDRRALFWLDGHYSGPITGKGKTECPVVGELDAIGAHARKDHVILIDDAREFGVHPDYPPIPELRERLLAINPGYDVRVEHDCIMALPPR